MQHISLSLMLPTSGTDILQRREPQLEALRQAHARAHDTDLRSAEHLDRVVLLGGAAAIIASANHLHELDGALRPGSFVLSTAGWEISCGDASITIPRLARSRRWSSSS